MSRRWVAPPPPFERDRVRWVALCLDVVDRIEQIRAKDDAEWCAFGRPLPEQLEVLSLPIGPVLPGPATRPRITSDSSS